MWLLYSILSVIFASLMQVLLKKCLTNIDPFVSTLYRNFLIFLFSISLVFIKNTKHKLFSISKKDLLILVIVSICTFFAYIFYFLAISKGDLKNIIAIDKLSIVLVMILSIFILNESLTFYDIIGTILLILGSFIIVYK